MADVIVYQMGKVASTAICDALRSAEINAVQSHFLGEKNLAGVLKNLITPDLEDLFIHHGTGQLVQNIETTRKVLWYKKYKQKEGKKLKVITLARDPMNWYRANFVQNLEGYCGALKDWVNENHPGHCGERDFVWYLRTFHVDLFNHLAAIKSQPGSAQFQSEVIALRIPSETMPARRDGLPEVLVRHLNILNRPLIWFDRFFAPIFDVDIFKEDFDVEKGYRHFTNDFCAVLLIRYENLGEVHGVIGDFVGIEGFSPQKVNTSDSKPYASELFQAFENLNDQTAAIDKIYSSKYCTYFGYTPDFRIRNSGQ
jgi:hypothetical protein